MITTLLTLAIIYISLKAGILTMKLAWNLTKAVLLVVLPLTLIGLLIGGIVSLSLPILVIGTLAIIVLPFLTGRNIHQ